MSLVGKIMALLRSREPIPEAAAARELSQRIGKRADEIKEHLNVYHRSRDPFGALVADIYTKDQVKRIHIGSK